MLYSIRPTIATRCLPPICIGLLLRELRSTAFHPEPPFHIHLERTFTPIPWQWKRIVGYLHVNSSQYIPSSRPLPIYVDSYRTQPRMIPFLGKYSHGKHPSERGRISDACMSKLFGIQVGSKSMPHSREHNRQ